MFPLVILIWLIIYVCRWLPTWTHKRHYSALLMYLRCPSRQVHSITSTVWQRNKTLRKRKRASLKSFCVTASAQHFFYHSFLYKSIEVPKFMWIFDHFFCESIWNCTYKQLCKDHSITQCLKPQTQSIKVSRLELEFCHNAFAHAVWLRFYFLGRSLQWH